MSTSGAIETKHGRHLGREVSQLAFLLSLGLAKGRRNRLRQEIRMPLIALLKQGENPVLFLVLLAGRRNQMRQEMHMPLTALLHQRENRQFELV